MYQEPALMLDLTEDAAGPSSFVTPLDAWRGSFIPFENQRQSYVDPLNFAPPPPQLFSNSSPLHHYAAASSSSSRINDEALGTGSWVVDGANELLFPSYGNPSSSVWVNRPQIAQHWYGNGDRDRDLARTSSTTTTQALSLSLSSNPPPELPPVTHFQDGFRQESLRVPDEVPVYTKFSVPSRDPRCGGLGPLGPFTGYAAILKNSKFLRPAQQLLDEFCSVVIGSEFSRSSEAESNNCNGMLLSGASSPAIYSSSAETGHGEVSGSSGGSASKTPLPEFQQRKTKLLYMQEEVCRRYKQYHQQMQMVVSSFESVAGLSGATPYTSLALKGVSKHFRSLKKAISDQLCHCIKALREELMSSSPGSSYKGGENAVKYIDKTLRKQKAAAEVGLNFFDRSQQPVWRPQRGLPERAVSVLRAWLFDHFLHPYPTDTDKHMLATQTGLSRNQVSNWFINARVRLWKPMVEEIHMLETKGVMGMDLNFSKENDALLGGALEGHHPSDEMLEALSSKQPMDCSPVLDEESSRALEQWHCEKRSRLDDCGIDGGLLSFATAYQQVGGGGGGMDIEGLGVVSLTLGLQHDDGSKRGPHQKTMMSPRFGTHLLHDFVG